MAPVIRPAIPTDGVAIARIQVMTWRAVYGQWIPEVVAALDLDRTAANWAQAVEQPGQRITVAEDTGTIIGYAHSGPADADDPADSELYALYVHPDVQGRGTGRQLVADALAEPGEWVVWALERYEPALRFYERVGFRRDPGPTRAWRGLTEVSYRRAHKSTADRGAQQR